MNTGSKRIEFCFSFSIVEVILAKEPDLQPKWISIWLIVRGKKKFPKKKTKQNAKNKKKTTNKSCRSFDENYSDFSPLMRYKWCENDNLKSPNNGLTINVVKHCIQFHLKPSIVALSQVYLRWHRYFENSIRFLYPSPSLSLSLFVLVLSFRFITFRSI